MLMALFYDKKGPVSPSMFKKNNTEQLPYSLT